ncbi:MAG: hydrogenase maturation protease [Archaeoglobales archaeon]|nr:hydrogenase maturation protease [Archaeoglobales archaeon]
MGNPIYSDDRIGLIVGEKLKEKLEAEGFEVKILERMGYTLIDYIAGHETVFVVDSIKGKVGEIVLIDNLEDLKIRFSKSPHYAGLPETIELMKALNLSVPKKLVVIGIGVKNPYTISEKMSPELELMLESIASEVYCTVKIYVNSP